jgi:hypothetical protein
MAHCNVCGAPMDWAPPSGVCSQSCLRAGQGFPPRGVVEGLAPAGASWWIEDKISGKGFSVRGAFADAVDAAWDACTSDGSVLVVWALPANMRAAEVELRGVRWRAPIYRGAYGEG